MRLRSILALSAFLLLLAYLAGAAVPDKAEFLASLSVAAPAQPSAAPASPAPTQAPAPEFLQTSTGCTSDAQCPAGKLCCAGREVVRAVPGASAPARKGAPSPPPAAGPRRSRRRRLSKRRLHRRA